MTILSSISTRINLLLLSWRGTEVEAEGHTGLDTLGYPLIVSRKEH